MTGNITNQVAAEACLAVLKENLQAASDQDATAYATLVAAARAETTQELADLQKNSCSTRCFLLKLLNKRQDPCWSRLNRKRSAQRLFYRDHITEAYHTFVKEADGWKIQETVMTNTEFL